MLIYATPLIPYHRLAGKPSWWRTLLGFGLVAAVGVAVIGGVQALDVNPVVRLALDLGAVAALLPLTFLAVALTQGRRPGTLSSVAGHLRMRWLFTCVLVAVPTVGLATLFGRVAVDPVMFLPMLMVTVALAPVQAAAEEYLCRGWILQSIGGYFTSPWYAVGVQAVVFALLHGRWDFVVIGAVTGWLAVRTGGLEAGIALSVVSNAVVCSLGTHLGWPAVFVGAYGLVVRWLATRLRVGTTARGAMSLTPLADVSRRRVPTARGPVLTNRSSRADVSSPCGR